MATISGFEPCSKRAYVQTLRDGLQQKQSQLGYVKRKVRGAATAGGIGVSEQLENAEKAADSSLQAFKDKLQQLDNSNDESWEELKFGIDVAWEDLSLSIKKIVARF